MFEKVQKLFKNNFDTKNFFLVLRGILVLFGLILVINFTSITLSKYASAVDASIAPNIAFFVTDVGSSSQTLKLGQLIPSASPYFYTFSVANYQDDKRVNVNVEYTIEFTTTTNLPLAFKLYKNTTDYSGNGIITSDTIVANPDGMYIRKLKTNSVGNFTYQSNEVHTYVLKVDFPENYKNNAEAYEGVIELAEVTVNAKQIV